MATSAQDRNSALASQPQLSDAILKHINAYALVAGAAGVSIAALVQPSAAEIVYTPANYNIPANTNHIYLDLNHDGVPDFGFFFYYKAHYYFAADLKALPVAGGVIVAGRGYAAPLSRGVQIGPGQNFAEGGSQVMERTHGYNYSVYGRYSRHAYGPWANKDRYLGIEFSIDGEVHYGWIRLTVSIGKRLEPLSATVDGYAYETVPNQSILAGQLSDGASAPAERSSTGGASLGALALGADRMSR